MMIIAGIFGAVLMTAFGTYYFRIRKEKERTHFYVKRSPRLFRAFCWQEACAEKGICNWRTE